MLFFTASRGHDPDIGGLTPGSMPPDSRIIAEEGVLVEDFILLAGRPWPTRNLDQNVGDIKVQIAVNEKSVQ